MKGPGEAYAASAVAWALARVGERTYLLRCLAFVEDAGWSKPVLLGWTPVERLLSGHRQRSWTDA